MWEEQLSDPVFEHFLKTYSLLPSNLFIPIERKKQVLRVKLIPGRIRQHAVIISALLVCTWGAGNGAQCQSLPQNQVWFHSIWSQPCGKAVLQCDVVSF